MVGAALVILIAALPLPAQSESKFEIDCPRTPGPFTYGQQVPAQDYPRGLPPVPAGENWWIWHMHGSVPQHVRCWNYATSSLRSEWGNEPPQTEISCVADDHSGNLVAAKLFVEGSYDCFGSSFGGDNIPAKNCRLDLMHVRCVPKAR